MNGIRVARKYLEGQSDTELFGIWQTAKKDDSKEVAIIRNIIEGIWDKRKSKQTSELYAALHRLSIRQTVRIDWIAVDRISVEVDGEYFGIWDTVRKTFVD